MSALLYLFFFSVTVPLSSYLITFVNIFQSYAVTYSLPHYLYYISHLLLKLNDKAKIKE